MVPGLKMTKWDRLLDPGRGQGPLMISAHVKKKKKKKPLEKRTMEHLHTPGFNLNSGFLLLYNFLTAVIFIFILPHA